MCKVFRTKLAHENYVYEDYRLGSLEGTILLRVVEGRSQTKMTRDKWQLMK